MTASDNTEQRKDINTIRQKADTVWAYLPHAGQSTTKECVIWLYGRNTKLMPIGRQPKWWLDNITEWTGLSIGDAVKMTQDRDVWTLEKLRNCPQRSTTTMRHDDDDDDDDLDEFDDDT